MTSKFVKIMERANTSVDFYLGSDDLHEHIKKTYIDAGKCLEWRNIEYLDDDQLILKYTSIWKDEESTQEILEDPIFIEDSFLGLVYNFEHGIKTTLAELDGKNMLNL